VATPTPRAGPRPFVQPIVPKPLHPEDELASDDSFGADPQTPVPPPAPGPQPATATTPASTYVAGPDSSDSDGYSTNNLAVGQVELPPTPQPDATATTSARAVLPGFSASAPA
ncbi:unnamed protein product, partial [Ectocarpus sp. 8 AP-2014]